MAAIGDNIEVLQNGGLQSLELKYDKGLGAGLTYYKLMPATLEDYYINRGMGEEEETLDDNVHVGWYRHYFRIRFGQMDAATLNEMFATVFLSTTHISGAPVRFTFMDGSTAEVTMHVRKVGGVGSQGPSDWRGVILEGWGHTSTPATFTP